MLEREEKNVTIYNIQRMALALELEPYKLLKPEASSADAGSLGFD